MIVSIRYNSGATVYVRVVRPSDGYYWDFQAALSTGDAWVPVESNQVKVSLAEQSDPEQGSRYSGSILLPQFSFDVVVEYVDSTLNDVIGEDTVFSQGTPFAPVAAPDVTPPSDQGGNYEHSKAGIGAMYPVNAIRDAWGHLDPLITPSQLKARHLFGIPLVSYMVDPITKQRQVMTDPLLKDLIDRAVSIAEAETHIDIMPRQYRHKHAFDRAQYAALGYTMLPKHPVQSLEKLSVTGSNGIDLYVVPPDWVEVAYIHTGQINIIPLNIAFMYGGFYAPNQGSTGGGGNAFLSILGQNPWIPAYWQTEYTTGFPDGKLPTIVNELIGVIAAIEVLGLLATTNARNSSHSVGVDGLSQSISTPGPQIYDARIQLLEKQRDLLVRKIRSMYGTKLFTGVI